MYVHIFAVTTTLREEEKDVRQPGIEPGSIAWKATMLTFTPPTLLTYWVMGTVLYIPLISRYECCSKYMYTQLKDDYKSRRLRILI